MVFHYFANATTARFLQLLSFICNSRLWSMDSSTVFHMTWRSRVLISPHHQLLDFDLIDCLSGSFTYWHEIICWIPVLVLVLLMLCSARVLLSILLNTLYCCYVLFYWWCLLMWLYLLIFGLLCYWSICLYVLFIYIITECKDGQGNTS